jgi:hypothetical protein
MNKIKWEGEKNAVLRSFMDEFVLTDYKMRALLSHECSNMESELPKTEIDCSSVKDKLY